MRRCDAVRGPRDEPRFRAARPCPAPEAWIPPLIPKQEQAHWVVLRVPRRHRLDGLTEGLEEARGRLPGSERGSRILELALNPRCERVRATEHAPRGSFGVLERFHGFKEILGRGGGVLGERRRVTPPHPERGLVTLREDPSRHG